MITTQSKAAILMSSVGLLLFQTFIFLEKGTSVDAHLAFGGFLGALVLVTIFFPKKGYAPFFLQPINWLSLSFFLSYWLAPIVIMLQPFKSSSYVFSFHADDSVLPLLIASVSYTGIVVGGYLVVRITRSPKLPPNLLKYHPSLSMVRFIVFFYIVLLIFKGYFVYNGWIGSLVGFAQAPILPLYATILKPFTELTVLLFSYLCYIACQRPWFWRIVLFFFIVDVSIHLTMGDRRDILLFLAPLLSIRYFFYSGKITWRTIVSILIFLLLIFGLATKINHAIDREYSAQGVSYFAGVTNGVTDFLADPFYGFQKSTDVIVAFVQTQMLDAAITARRLGYTYEHSPLVIFLSSLVPGAHTLGLAFGTAAELQQPMYENALTYQTVPNLTNPLGGETYVHGGYLGVFLSSILSGMLMMLLYRLSSLSPIIWFWYWAFFMQLTMGFGSSLTGQVFPLKVLFLVIVVKIIIVNLLGAAIKRQSAVRFGVHQ